MALAQVRSHEPEPFADPPLADSIGWYGWLAFFAVAIVVLLLVARF
jgi:hypothetical protein